MGVVTVGETAEDGNEEVKISHNEGDWMGTQREITTV